MSNTTTSASERISVRSLSDAIAKYAAAGFDREVVFEPAPLDADRRRLLEVISNFISLSDECGSLAGLLSALEGAAANGDVTMQDLGSAMWVIRQHLELLSDAALTEANARYRIHLADLHEAREAGRREGRARRKPEERGDE